MEPLYGLSVAFWIHEGRDRIGKIILPSEINSIPKEIEKLNYITPNKHIKPTS